MGRNEVINLHDDSLQNNNMKCNGPFDNLLGNRLFTMLVNKIILAFGCIQGNPFRVL